MKKGKGLLLLILAAAQFMVVLDSSIVNIALSSISTSLGFAPENLQWVVTAYILAFGGFLLFGGRAADLFGRRKVFLLGLVGFTIGSLLAGAAQNEVMMIVARAIQGLTAAFMSPAALSIILTEYKEGAERNKALGVWGAVGAGGAAAGLIIGGIVTEYLGWRWDFIINLPIGIALIALALKYVPAHHSEAEHRDLDARGAVLVTGGLMALVYGLTNAPKWGWEDIQTIIWLASSVVLIGLFIINEMRVKHPLIDLKIFKIRNLTGANIVQLFITSGMMSMFFFISLYVQQILAYKPLITGLAFLPFAVVVGITATQSSRFIGRFGPKPFMIVGPIVMAAGLFILSHISLTSSYVEVILPGIIVMAFGAGLTFIALSVAATSGVPKNQSGLASGLLNTSQQIGGALGLAILAGVATSTAKGHISEGIASATVTGYHTAILVACTFALAAAVVTILIIRNKKNGSKSDEPIIVSH
ncbi:MAG: MFS transporter [Candidatus Saccharimonadales bacterium]